jgi:hypothetical protein
MKAAYLILESEAQWPVGHPVRQGHIYKLGPNDPHAVLRGSSPKARTNISPTFPADATHAKLDHSQLDQLELKAVHNSSRAIVIDFGVAWLRVCLSILYLTMNANRETILGAIPDSYIHPIISQITLG